MINNSFTPFPLLTTERLTLRQLTPEDANEIFIMRSNENLAKYYVDDPKAYTLEKARKHIDHLLNENTNNEWIVWGVTLKNQPRLIGSICLWNISVEHATGEIGYEFKPEYHGQGIAQEALRKVTEYGFKTMKLCAIEAFPRSEHIASIKLLERNGFVKKETFQTERELSGMEIYILDSHNYKCSHTPSKPTLFTN